MKVVNILHLSDFHGEKFEIDNKTVDHKDVSVSRHFTDHFEHDPLKKQFIHDIRSIANSTVGKIDLILFTGDLGDKGHVEEVSQGMEFLIGISEALEVERGEILIVPGNHDLNQQGEDVTEMFQNFTSVCNDNNISNYLNDFKPKQLYKNDLQIISMNSCLGGNTKQFNYFNESDYKSVVEKFQDNIDNIISSNPDYQDIKYQLNLDIPAIGMSQLNVINSLISENKTDISLIIMHHNAIPSTIAEIRPYSYLIDGGLFLKKINVPNKTIILLHGHTHESMEYITKIPFKKTSNSVLSIGVSGFDGISNGDNVANIISIYLDDDNHFIRLNIYQIIYQKPTFINKDMAFMNKDNAIPLGFGWQNLPMNTFLSVNNILDKIENATSETHLLEMMITNEHDYFDIRRGSETDPLKWKYKRIR